MVEKQVMGTLNICLPIPPLFYIFIKTANTALAKNNARANNNAQAKNTALAKNNAQAKKNTQAKNSKKRGGWVNPIEQAGVYYA